MNKKLLISGILGVALLATGVGLTAWGVTKNNSPNITNPDSPIPPITPTKTKIIDSITYELNANKNVYCVIDVNPKSNSIRSLENSYHVLPDIDGLPVTIIKSNSFDKVKSTAQEIEINANIDSIPNNLFENFTQLKKVNINSTSTNFSLGNATFKGDLKLTQLTFPANIISVGNECFSGTSITSFNFNSLTPIHIGTNAFANIKGNYEINLSAGVSYTSSELKDMGITNNSVIHTYNKTSDISIKNDWDKNALLPTELLTKIIANAANENYTQLETMLNIINNTPNGINFSIGNNSYADNINGTLVLDLNYSNFYNNGNIIPSESNKNIKYTGLKATTLGTWKGVNIFRNEKATSYTDQGLNKDFLTNTNKVLPNDILLQDFKIIKANDNKLSTSNYGEIEFSFNAKNYYDGTNWVYAPTPQGNFISTNFKNPIANIAPETIFDLDFGVVDGGLEQSNSNFLINFNKLTATEKNQIVRPSSNVTTINNLTAAKLGSREIKLTFSVKNYYNSSNQIVSGPISIEKIVNCWDGHPTDLTFTKNVKNKTIDQFVLEFNTLAIEELRTYFNWNKNQTPAFEITEGYAEITNNLVNIAISANNYINNEGQEQNINLKPIINIDANEFFTLPATSDETTFVVNNSKISLNKTLSAFINDFNTSSLSNKKLYITITNASHINIHDILVNINDAGTELVFNISASDYYGPANGNTSNLISGLNSIKKGIPLPSFAASPVLTSANDVFNLNPSFEISTTEMSANEFVQQFSGLTFNEKVAIIKLTPQQSDVIISDITATLKQGIKTASTNNLYKDSTLNSVEINYKATNYYKAGTPTSTVVLVSSPTPQTPIIINTDIPEQISYIKDNVTYDYKLNEDLRSYDLTSVISTSGAAIKIPATIDISTTNKIPVTSISAKLSVNTTTAKIDLSTANNLLVLPTGFINSTNNITAIDFSGAFALTTIERDAFVNTSKTTATGFDKLTNLSSIGENAFKGLGITKVDLSKSNQLTTINKDAFANNTTLADVTLPKNGILTTISQGSFSGIDAKLNINIPKTIVNLNNNAFNNGIISNAGQSNNQAITSIGTLTWGADANTYYYDESITNVAQSPINLLKLENFNARLSFEYAEANFLVPTHVNLQDSVSDKSVAINDSNNPGNEFIIQENDHSQGYSLIAYNIALANTTNLKPITLPNDYDGKPITTINHAFNSIKQVSEVIIPNNYTNIIDSAFYNATDLVSVNFLPGSKLQAIGTEAFYNCTSLKSINFPTSLIELGLHVFAGTVLEEITIPNTVQEIGIKCFENVTSLKKVTFASNSKLTTIHNNVFSGTSISEITIPNSVTQLSDPQQDENQTGRVSWFTDAPLLKTIKFEDDSNLRTLSYQALSINAPELTSISWGANPSLTTVSEYAFSFLEVSKNGKSTFELEFPNSVQYFADCNLNSRDGLGTNERIKSIKFQQGTVILDGIGRTNTHFSILDGVENFFFPELGSGAKIFPDFWNNLGIVHPEEGTDPYSPNSAPPRTLSSISSSYKAHFSNIYFNAIGFPEGSFSDDSSWFRNIAINLPANLIDFASHQDEWSKLRAIGNVNLIWNEFLQNNIKTVNGIQYYLNEDQISYKVIGRVVDASKTTITIPDEIDGKPVTEIQNINLDGLTSFITGNNIGIMDGLELSTLPVKRLTINCSIAFKTMLQFVLNSKSAINIDGTENIVFSTFNITSNENNKLVQDNQGLIFNDHDRHVDLYSYNPDIATDQSIINIGTTYKEKFIKKINWNALSNITFKEINFDKHWTSEVLAHNFQAAQNMSIQLPSGSYNKLWEKSTDGVFDYRLNTPNTYSVRNINITNNTTITIPRDVNGNQTVTEVNLDNNNCVKEMTKLVVDSNITSLCSAMFHRSNFGNDFKIQEIDFSKATSLKSIPNRFAKGALTLTKVDFSGLTNVSEIGASAFAGTSLNGTIDLTPLSNLVTISKAAFANPSESLTISEIKLPNNSKLITIMQNAFGNFGGIINLPNTLKFISMKIFVTNGFATVPSLEKGDQITLSFDISNISFKVTDTNFASPITFNKVIFANSAAQSNFEDFFDWSALTTQIK